MKSYEIWDFHSTHVLLKHDIYPSLRQSYFRVWEVQSVWAGFTLRMRVVSVMVVIMTMVMAMVMVVVVVVVMTTATTLTKLHMFFRLRILYSAISGWWFGTWLLWLSIYIYIYIGNNNPNWLSYFSEGFEPPTRFFFVLPLPCCFHIVPETSRFRTRYADASIVNVTGRQFHQQFRQGRMKGFLGPMGLSVYISISKWFLICDGFNMFQHQPSEYV